MAVTCDPNTLPNDARCFASCIPPGDHAAVQTYLLAQIALALGAVTSAEPSALANAARCFNECIGNQMSVQNYLLCQIANQ